MFFVGLIAAVLTIAATSMVTGGYLVLIPYGGIVGGIAMFLKGLGQRRRGR